MFSVNGTNRRGNNAAPIFQLQVAQYKFGNGSFCTFQSGAIQSLPDPYEPAGRPVNIETKHTVTVTTHLYVGDQLKLRKPLDVEQHNFKAEHTDCLCRLGHSMYGSLLLCHLPCGSQAGAPRRWDGAACHPAM